MAHTWLTTLYQLDQEHTPCVVVTVLTVKGHAPREAGVKMLVTANKVYYTIGGGNLEESAIQQARVMLAGKSSMERKLYKLNPKSGDYAVQCCGGEVEVLFELHPNTQPSVAIFGVGHVGLALAKVLSVLPIKLYLLDSRADMVSAERLICLSHATADVLPIHAPIPDVILPELPPSCHVVIMTHDHAEDLFICEGALRNGNLGYIGLIGSKVKWQHFKSKLQEAGFSSAEIGKITTPIGSSVSSKAPEVIAISTAHQLLPYLIDTNQKEERVL